MGTPFEDQGFGLYLIAGLAHNAPDLRKAESME